MAWVAVGTGVVALGSTAFKYAKAKQQQKRADQLRDNAQNPGFQVNQALIDNANTLRDRYSNYTLPGYQQALANINQSGANAMYLGEQGASSSGDIIDLASKIAYGQNQSTNQLAIQNAQGKDEALGQYLNANALAGDQYQQQNAYQRQQYQALLNEAGALNNAGQQNEYGAINDLGNVASSYLMNLPSRAKNKQRYGNIGLQGQQALPNGQQLGSQYNAGYDPNTIPYPNLPY